MNTIYCTVKKEKKGTFSEVLISMDIESKDIRRGRDVENKIGEL